MVVDMVNAQEHMQVAAGEDIRADGHEHGHVNGHGHGNRLGGREHEAGATTNALSGGV